MHTLGLDRDKRWQFCRLTRSIKGQSAQQRDRLDGTQLGVGWMKEIWEGGGRRLKESFKKNPTCSLDSVSRRSSFHLKNTEASPVRSSKVITSPG